MTKVATTMEEKVDGAGAQALRALTARKYRLLFSTKGLTTPGPLGIVRDFACNLGYISG